MTAANGAAVSAAFGLFFRPVPDIKSYLLAPSPKLERELGGKTGLLAGRALKKYLRQLALVAVIATGTALALAHISYILCFRLY